MYNRFRLALMARGQPSREISHTKRVGKAGKDITFRNL